MKKRFSILSLLILTFVIAAILGGYRWGAQLGYDHGEQEWDDEMPLSRSHSLSRIELDEEIGDWDWSYLVPGDSKAELVKWMVTEEIESWQWADMGGPFSIYANEEGDEIDVFAPRSVQDKITSLLDDLSVSPDKFNRFAKRKLLEVKEVVRAEEEFALRRLEPATELLSRPVELLERDAILIGRYSVTTAEASEPVIACFEFFPNPDETSRGTWGGVKVHYKNEDERPPLSESFQMLGRGRIQIGRTYYSAGRIDEGLVLVSEGEPTEILVLSEQGRPTGEQTGEGERE